MNRIETIWCEQMHSDVMWPIHGKYRCGKCFREYAVAFEAIEPLAAEHRTPTPIVASA
jgi:hypothetical protein